MKSLPFAQGFDLPANVAADTVLGLGIKGAGKTYTGMRLAESILAAGGQIIAIDITGVWWGLTSSADGKREGFPLYVFGGPKSDLPLNPEAGELVARTLIESRASAVLDLSLTRKSDQHRFLATFLEALYLTKASHRDYVCTLFMDEANRLAPQKPGPDQTKVLGASEDIVLQGRSRGLGLYMMTQRPAALNKNLTTQSGHLILGRVASPQDQNAVREWLDIHATPEVREQVLGRTLAHLPMGEVFYLSTSAGGSVDRLKILKRETFDSSRTPEPGERPHVAKVRAAIDVAKLSGEIQQLAQRAAENKPEHLKARIHKLENLRDDLVGQIDRMLAEKKAAPPPAPVLPPNTRRLIERTLAFLEVRNPDTLAERVAELREEIVRDREQRATAVRLIAEHLAKLSPPPTFPTPADLPANWRGARAVSAHAAKFIQPTAPAAATNGDAVPVPPGLERATLNKPERALLTAIAQHGTLGRSAAMLHAGYRPSGKVSDAFARFIREGWVETGGDGLQLTSLGRYHLGEFEALPTGAELRALILRKARNAAERAIFAAVFNAYPRAKSRAEFMAAAGYRPSGKVSDAFARMIAAGWATTAGPGSMVAAADLFPDHDPADAEEY